MSAPPDADRSHRLPWRGEQEPAPPPVNPVVSGAPELYPHHMLSAARASSYIRLGSQGGSHTSRRPPRHDGRNQGRTDTDGRHASRAQELPIMVERIGLIYKIDIHTCRRLPAASGPLVFRLKVPISRAEFGRIFGTHRWHDRAFCVVPGVQGRTTLTSSGVRLARELGFDGVSWRDGVVPAIRDAHAGLRRAAPVPIRSPVLLCRNQILQCTNPAI